MIYLNVQMAPPTRRNSRAHARKDNIIARLHVRIASLQQRIPRPNNTPRDKSTVTCYECGVTGHYSYECPQKLMKAANNAAPPAQQQRRVAAGRKSGPGNPNNRNGRLYRMNAIEAPEAPNVVLGMFSC